MRFKFGHIADYKKIPKIIEIETIEDLLALEKKCREEYETRCKNKICGPYRGLMICGNEIIVYDDWQ
jgi:hypothetical protein